jgi:methionyl-tRNA formyltransferase
MAGDRESGMMVMKMDEGLDTGPVALVERVTIGPNETAGDLHDRLMHAGAALMVEALASLEAGRLILTPQPAEGVTYARKIDKAETRIDWCLPAVEVHNRIRGLAPIPGAWCEMNAAGKTERLKVLRSALAPGAGEPGTAVGSGLTIACREGAVRLTELQRAGGRPLTAEEFLRGVKIEEGTRLS